MKKISMAVALSACISVHAVAEPNSEQQQFLNKYIQVKSNAYKTGIDVSDAATRNKMNKDFDIDNAVKSSKDLKTQADLNATDYRIDINNALSNKQAKKTAEDISAGTKTKTFNAKINNYKDYILNDKELNFKSKMGKYAADVTKIQEEKYKGINYKNEFLAEDERLIICISSSIPKQTILNYFQEMADVASDTSFVMNGFIGNNPKYAKPTINYISDLLQKDGQGSENRYMYRVDINPKIFTKYSIGRAPAVIFIKNYDPTDEMMGAHEDDKKKVLKTEDVFVSYGDSNIVYVLKKINEKAKSPGLQKMIKKIEGGYFNAK